MHHEFIKNPGKPVLVCVPGLLGGPEDFRGMEAAFQNHFQVLYVDPNQSRRATGLSNLSLEETQAVSFDSSAPEIKTVLANYGVTQAYFLGISLGGKIVYDFAIRYPDYFLGAVISDVGPSSFMESALAQLVESIVARTDLTLPWDELKQSFRELIPERNLRSLIQSQVSYPNQKPPGIWKTAMRGLRTLLRNNSIDDQLEDYAQADRELLKRNRGITVLTASHLSGITPDGLAKMKEWKSIRLIFIDNSAHFLHVTHKSDLQKAVLNLI